MASGGEPRRADVADNLTLADPLAHPNDVPGRMVVAGRGIPSADVAVVDHQPVAITSVVIPLSHPAVTAGVGSVMPGHIALPQLDPTQVSPLPRDAIVRPAYAEREVFTENAVLPGTLSPVVTAGLLRKALGFDG